MNFLLILFVNEILSFDFFKITEEINKSMQNLQNIEDNSKKVEQFNEMKIPGVFSIKMSKHSAVFILFELNLVLKRKIYKIKVADDESSYSINFNHKNIISTYLIVNSNYNDKNNIVWIFMDYLPIKIGNKKKYKLYEVMKISKDICSGIKYLNDKNIAHLDIKKGNIVASCSNLNENRIYAFNEILKIIEQLEKNQNKKKTLKYSVNNRYDSIEKTDIEIFFKNKDKLNKDLAFINVIEIFDDLLYDQTNFNSKSINSSKNLNLNNSLISTNVEKDKNTNSRTQCNSSHYLKKRKIENKKTNYILNIFYSKNGFKDIKKKDLELHFYILVGDFGTYFSEKIKKAKFFDIFLFEDLIKGVGEKLLEANSGQSKIKYNNKNYEIKTKEIFLTDLYLSRKTNMLNPLFYVENAYKFCFQNENFLINNLTYKIIDFGNSKIYADTKNDCQKYHGTEPYLPPEIYNEQKFYLNSDIWNLGLLSYFLFFNKKIIAKMDTLNVEIIEKQIQNNFKNYELKNKELLEYFKHCINFYIKKRYDSTTCLKKIDEIMNKIEKH